MKEEKETLSDAQKKALASNLNALYVYLDAFMDQMTEEEIIEWTKVLRELDPNFEKEEDD